MKADAHDRSTVKEAALFLGLILAGLLLWHGPVLLGSQVFCGGDLTNHFIPMRIAQLRHGWFSGWQPHTFGGRPLLDEVQMGAFYPVNWIHLLGLSVERGFSVIALLHLLVGGLGFCLLARTRFSFWPAGLAGFIWTFGALQQLKITSGITIFNAVYTWVPWMWMAAERQSLRRGPGLAWCGMLAACGALQLSAGAPQPVQITWAGLALWTLGRLFRPGPDETRGGIAMGFVVAGLLALLACTPMLVGVLRFQSESWPRTMGDEFEYLSDGSVAPRVILTWLFPELYAPGNDEALYWGSSVGYHETSIYTGILPLLLACFGFIVSAGRPRGEGPLCRRWLACLAAMMVLGFLIALGSHGFLFYYLTKFVPTFSYFRVPARWLLWFVAGVALLAAAGLERLLGDGTEDRRPFVVWLALAGVFIAAFAILRATMPGALEGLGLGGALAGAPLELAARKRDELLAFAGQSVTWALMVATVGGIVGALLLKGRMSRNALLAILLLLAVGDLYRFWTPWTTSIPDGITPQEVETEVPFHRIGSGSFRLYFYPETDLVREAAKGGRTHYDDLLPSYFYDQNQREFLNERPAVPGLEITRGYQQLQLRSYVEDYYASIVPPEDGRIGAFLKQTEVRDRRFFDAYNVTRLFSYEFEQLDRLYTSIGLVRKGPVGPHGAIEWENPHARGWAWLSDGKSFLDAEPRAALGTVTIPTREAEHWQVTATTTGPAILHFSAPDYGGWRITATGPGGEIVEGLSGRAIALPSAGTWTVNRDFFNIGLKPGNLLLAAIALAISLSFIGVGLRTSRGASM